ncbi:MAG: hypothetical protein KA015_01585 [Spirochaetes bacterium]|nr:hypothetical protein [Spirochaetota bacterium]
MSINKVFIIFLIAAFPIFSQQNSMQPVERYIEIEKRYFEWKDGLFGSRNYRRRELLSFLSSVYKLDIETTPDFAVKREKSGIEKRIIFRFGYKSGLVIDAEVDADSVKDLKIDKTGIMWFGGKIIAVKGRLRKFFLADSPGKDDLILFFDSAEIIISERK